MITFQGKPVTAGMVTFRNDDKGLVAGMQLDAEGRYQLRFAGGLQIPVGAYDVTISPPEPHVPTAGELASGDAAVKTSGAHPEGGLARHASPDIPQKYRSPKTSGLTFEVNAGENTFDLDMRN